MDIDLVVVTSSSCRYIDNLVFINVTSTSSTLRIRHHHRHQPAQSLQFTSVDSVDLSRDNISFSLSRSLLASSSAQVALFFNYQCKSSRIMPKKS